MAQEKIVFSIEDLSELIENINKIDIEIMNDFFDENNEYEKNIKENIKNIKKLYKMFNSLNDNTKLVKDIIKEAKNIIQADKDNNVYSSLNIVELIQKAKTYCNKIRNNKIDTKMAPVVITPQRNNIAINRTTIDVLKDFDDNCSINDIFSSKNIKFKKPLSNFGIYIIKVIIAILQMRNNLSVSTRELRKIMGQKENGQNRHKTKFDQDIINVLENELRGNSYIKIDDDGNIIGYGDICSITKEGNDYFIYVTKIFHELMQKFNVYISKSIYNLNTITITRDNMLMQDYFIEKVVNTRNKNILKIDFEDVLKYCDDYPKDIAKLSADQKKDKKRKYKKNFEKILNEHKKEKNISNYENKKSEFIIYIN